MRTSIGDRLPRFTPSEAALLIGSIDFVGLNHYTTSIVEPLSTPSPYPAGYVHDLGAQPSRTAIVAPNSSHSGWPIAPYGLTKLLRWIDQSYSSYNPAAAGTAAPARVHHHHVPILITECGISLVGGAAAGKSEGARSPELVLRGVGSTAAAAAATALATAEAAGDLLDDGPRIMFLMSYLRAAVDAVVEDGVVLRGFFVWSLLDNFEVSGMNECFYVLTLARCVAAPRHSLLTSFPILSFARPFLTPPPSRSSPLHVHTNSGPAGTSKRLGSSTSIARVRCTHVQTKPARRGSRDRLHATASLVGDRQQCVL